MTHRCPKCGYAEGDKYPLTERLISGLEVNGWYLTRLERKMVSILRKEPMLGTGDLADRVYADSDDPPISANNNIGVVMCRLRSVFGISAFPKRPSGPGAEYVAWFNPDAFERTIAGQGSRLVVLAAA